MESNTRYRTMLVGAVFTLLLCCAGASRPAHADAGARATPSVASSDAGESLCGPGANTNPLHIFKVTITCLVSLQAFKDPDLKVKDSCIVKVGFDTVTDLIPAAKVKLLERDAPLIARSATDVSGYLKQLNIEKSLISGLDKLGNAVVLVKGSPLQTVELFITSDEALASLSEKLQGHLGVLKALTHLQGLMKNLFLGLTGIGDAKQCLGAFKSKPKPEPAPPPLGHAVACHAGSVEGDGEYSDGAVIWVRGISCQAALDLVKPQYERIRVLSVGSHFQLGMFACSITYPGGPDTIKVCGLGEQEFRFL